ncbi:hypothetical protein AAC723_26590, partial (plasmid) [Klebsiella pneumoniae]
KIACRPAIQRVLEGYLQNSRCLEGNFDQELNSYPDHGNKDHSNKAAKKALSGVKNFVKTVADYNETEKTPRGTPRPLQSVLRRCRKEPYLTCSDVFLNTSTFKSTFKDAIMPIRQAEDL